MATLAEPTTRTEAAEADPSGVVRYRGGDAIITGALVAGLEAVGRRFVEEGRFSERAALAGLRGPAVKAQFEQGAQAWLEQFDFDQSAPRLQVDRFIRKYRGEDFGVAFTFTCDGALTRGVYPVNLKDEATHTERAGKVRIGKRYGIIKRITGTTCSMRTNAPEQVAEFLTGDNDAALGVGVLALASRDGGRCALAYDALHVYALCGGSRLGSHEAAGEVRGLLDEVDAFCTEHALSPVSVYDNEGFLLQAQHHQAAKVFAYASVRAVARRVYTTTLLHWFTARFDQACVDLTIERLETLQRDVATSHSYL